MKTKRKDEIEGGNVEKIEKYKNFEENSNDRQRLRGEKFKSRNRGCC